MGLFLKPPPPKLSSDNLRRFGMRDLIKGNDVNPFEIDQVASVESSFWSGHERASQTKMSEL